MQFLINKCKNRIKLMSFEMVGIHQRNNVKDFSTKKQEDQKFKISRPLSSSHRRSNTFSYSAVTPASKETSEKVEAIASWGLSNLTVKDKQQIVPCTPEILKEFESSHYNSLETVRQQKYFWISAVGISIATGASGYYANLYPLVSSYATGLLSCASFALGFFFNKAQSDSLVNIKAEQDKLCQLLKKQYDKLGKELIVKYVESSSGDIDLELDEKSNGNVQQQPNISHLSESSKRQTIIDQATNLLNNWNNIKEVSVERLFIDSGSASDATLPLYEAAMTIVNDNLKKSNSLTADTPMQAFFNKQKANHTIKQIEIQKNKELYQYINANKEQIEAETAKRLEAAKKGIEAEVRKYSEEAALQIEAAKNQAIINASDVSDKQLHKLKNELEENARRQFLEATAQAELASKQALIAQNQASDAQSLIINLFDELRTSKEQINKTKAFNIELSEELKQFRGVVETVITDNSDILKDLLERTEAKSNRIEKVASEFQAHIKAETAHLHSKPGKKKIKNFQLNNTSIAASSRQCCSEKNKAIYNSPSKNEGHKSQSNNWIP
jgi:hypothetical protein